MFDFSSIFASLITLVSDLFLGQIMQLVLGFFGGAAG